MVEDHNLEEKVVRGQEQFSLVHTNKGEKKHFRKVKVFVPLT